MDLIFLGRGSAFNTSEGNTSAFFIENNDLFLIDCGESVFNTLQQNNLLNYQYNIIITHTHSDHIGSLGTLISKLFYTYGIKANIIVPKNKEFITNIFNILNIYGCNYNMYNIIIVQEFTKKFNSFNSIKLIESKHVDNLKSFGILFETNDGLIYYSGDTNDLKLIKNILNNPNLNKIYLDTCIIDYPGNVHMYIELLNSIVTATQKEKIYCMHIDNDECLNRIKELGFNIVETINQTVKKR